jgi:uncharacterized protein (DUF1499 family)
MGPRRGIVRAPDPEDVRLTNQRPSSIAIFGSFVAAVAAALAIAGPLLANLGVLQPLAGFGTFALGGLLALAGLLLGAVGLRATRSGRPGRSRAWFAVAVGGGILAILLSGALSGRGVPRINDITTSPDDPPVFDPDGPNRGRDMAYPADYAAQQRAAYPDLAPIRVDAPPGEAFERARGAAESLGWEITAADPSRGVFEAQQVSRLFRFVDDVVVRVRPANGGSVVDVRSKSRDGQGDMGVNAARIRAFASALAGAPAAR